MGHTTVRSRSARLAKAASVAVAFLLAAGMGAAVFTTRASAGSFSQEQLDPNEYMFKDNQIHANTENAVLDSLDIKNPNNIEIKTIDGLVSQDAGGTWSVIDGTEGNSVTVRVPVEAATAWGDDSQITSNAAGQALLDGLELIPTWKGIGTYGTGSDEKPLMLRMWIGNMVDAVAHQRNNNKPYTFNQPVQYAIDGVENNGAAFWGDSKGRGYIFYLTAKTGGGYENTYAGVQEAETRLRFLYEDLTNVTLPDGAGMLTTIGQLDGDYLGTEGVQILDNATVGYRTSQSDVAWGDITGASGYQGNVNGYSPHLNGPDYLFSDGSPVAFATNPDAKVADHLKRNYTSIDMGVPGGAFVDYEQAVGAAGYTDWVDASVTYLGETAGVKDATVRFKLIDTVGLIGFPLSFATIASVQPPAPVKTVDKKEASVGEDITYTVTQKINKEGYDQAWNIKYRSWSLTDELDARLTAKSLKVFDGGGRDVTATAGKWTQTGHTVRWEFGSDYLKDTLWYDGGTYTFQIVATPKEDAAGSFVANKATTTFNNKYTSDSNTVKTLVNSAVPTVSKKADRFEYGVGDTIAYTVTASNTKAGSIAKDYQVNDIVPAGLDLDMSSVSVSGVPASVDYPVLGKNGQETSEKRKNTWKVEKEGASNFRLTIDYLPANTPVTIAYKATALAGSNTDELVNTATAWCENHLPGFTRAEAKDVVWVNSAKASIGKKADRFEWMPGDAIGYTLEVTNAVAGSIAKDVVVQDASLPSTLSLDAGSIAVSGVPASVDYRVKAAPPSTKDESRANTYKITKNANGFSVAIDYLPAGAKVTISYKAVASAASNAKEAVNTASATLSNRLPGWTKDEAHDIVWVNGAELEIVKQAEKYEWRVGDQVSYLVTVKNIVQNTIARDVLVEDASLPGFLSLDYESVQVEGVASPIDYKVRNDATSSKPESRDNGWSLSPSENGFKLALDYLPYGVTVRLTYHATALEDSNGKEIANTATTTAANLLPDAKKTEDSATVWVNSPGVTPVKAADDVVRKVGDTIKYHIDLTNANVGTVARNVVIEDLMLAEGVELDRNSIVVSDQDGNVFTGQCEVVQNTKSQDFTIKTKKNIVNEEDYWVYDKGLEQQDRKNPLGCDRELSLHVEYSAKIVSQGLAGKDVCNIVNTSSDEGPGGSDEEAVPVNGPALSLGKEVSKHDLTVGEKADYRLTVSQSREGLTIHNVVIEDAFESDAMEIDPETVQVYDNGWAETSGCAIVAEKGGFRIETHRDLRDGERMYVTYTAKAVSPSEKAVNTASAYADNAPKAVDKADVAIADAPEAAFETVKSSEPDPGTKVHVGDTIAYTLMTTNTGAAEGYALVRDYIPEGTSYVQGSVSAGGAYVAADAEGDTAGKAYVEFATGRLFPWQSVQGSFKATVGSDAGKSVVNHALTGPADEGTVPGDPANGEPGDPSNEVEHPIDAVVLGDTVTVYKSSDPETGTKVEAGQEIAYKLTAKNTGANRSGNTLVRDRIPEGAAYVDGSASDGGMYVAADAEGNATGHSYVEWVIGPLEVLAEKAVSFKVAVDEEPPSLIYNHAAFGRTEDGTVPGDPENPEPDDPTNETAHPTDDTPVPALLSAVKSSVPEPGTKVEDGQDIAYTITVANNGGTAAKNVAVVDNIPAYTAYRSVADGGVYNAGKNRVEWVVASIGPKASVSVGFTVTAATEGSARIVANQARYAEVDDPAEVPGMPADRLDNSTNIVEHPVPGRAAFETAKSSDPVSGTQVKAGDTITYRLATRNTGKGVGNVLVRDYLPEGTAYVDGSASVGGAYVAADAEGNATGRAYVEFAATLAPGESEEFSFRAAVAEDASGTVRNLALTTPTDTPATPGDPGNPEPGSPSNETEHPVQGAPAVEALKTSDPPSGTKVARGDIVTYTITLANKGDSEARKVAVWDGIPENTVYIEGSATNGGSRSKGGREGLAWVVDAIAPQSSVDLSFKVAVNAEGASEGTLVRNEASWQGNHPDLPTGPLPNKTNETEHPLATGALAVVKTSDPQDGTEVWPGQEITYTLTATNPGEAAAYHIAVWDAVPAGTAYVPGSATDGGEYDEEQEGIGWTISEIPPGESRALSFRAKVDEGLEPGSAVENHATFAQDHPDKPAGDLESKTNTVKHPLGKAAAAQKDPGTPHAKTGDALPVPAWLIVSCAALAAGAIVVAQRMRR